MSKGYETAGASTETEPLPVQFEYKLQDEFGRVLRDRVVVQRLQIEDIPSGASWFEGYIETPFGQFAWSGPLKDAVKTLNDVSLLCKSRKELALIDGQLGPLVKQRDKLGALIARGSEAEAKEAKTEWGSLPDILTLRNRKEELERTVKVLRQELADKEL